MLCPQDGRRNRADKAGASLHTRLMFRSAEALLRPKSIAIVGASDTSGSGWARAVFDNLAHGGFPARVYLINPKRDRLWDQQVYPSFAALPEKIDLGIVIIPAPLVPETLAEAAANGLKCALLYAARFGEGGDVEGQARTQAVVALCEKYGLRVSGPNCMGSISLREKLLLYPAPRVRALPEGPVGVVFQSGGTFQFWLQQAAARGLGFSYAISSGNELDLDLADYINFLVEDEHTRLIACMVEGVRRPAALLAAAEKALAAKKPILLVKVGRSAAGQQAAVSHTGALAGDDAVFDAVCAKYGITRCPSLDDMIETALAFSQGRLPRGERIGMAISSGGAKGLFLDYAQEEGATLATLTPETVAKLQPIIDPGVPAENPLDTGAGLATSAVRFTECCRIMVADPNVDLFAMYGMLPITAQDPANAQAYAGVRAATDKPVICFGRMAQNVTDLGRAFQAEVGLPYLHGMPATVRAAQALVRYAARVRSGVAPLPAPRGLDLAGAGLDCALAEHGLTPPRSGFAKTPAEAGRLAAALGFPVAVKIVSPEASHKSEVGGVALALGDEASVATAAQAMAERVRNVEGFLVQEMVDGVEMIVGARLDAQYGPIMVMGLGGVAVEAMRDIAIRLLPVDEALAREMIGSLRGKALLGEFRGRPARDVAALARAIAGLSRLFLAQNEYADFEINPLMVLGAGEGVRAVDVRLARRSS